MEASRIQIEVRTLTGEATTVSASATDAVSDLKVLLKLSFPPATTSPNFHLFFKGEKLRLQSQIGTHRIKPGEVLVLVPFVKKVASSHSEKCGQPEPSSSSRFDNRTMSKFADSAWSDLMQDLSYLRDDSGDGTPSVCNVGGFSGGEGSEDCAREVKRKREFGCDEMILEMLWDCRSKSVHYEEDYRSSIEDISFLFAEMVQHGLRCIAFCKTRKLCELVFCNTRIICNLSDLVPECADPHDGSYFPERILLYDQHPGGTGICVHVNEMVLNPGMIEFPVNAGLFSDHHGLCDVRLFFEFNQFLWSSWGAALEVLTSCHCTEFDGCPNCIQNFCCKSYNEVLHKDAAIMILKMWTPNL